MSDGDKGLRKYMSSDDRIKIGTRRTYHSTMIELTGKARPGKTARDRARRLGDKS